MTLKPLATCPLSSAPPFTLPKVREPGAEGRHRVRAWCEEVLQGEEVEIVEWVGADPRQPPHAVVVSFPSSDRPPAVLYLKVQDVQRHHLVRALAP